MTRPTDRQMLHDYATARDRLRRPDHRGLLMDYMLGIVGIALVVLVAWILWQISGGLVERLL